MGRRGHLRLLLTVKSVQHTDASDQDRDQDDGDDDRRPYSASLTPAAPPTVQERRAELALPQGVQFQQLAVGVGHGRQIFC